MTDYLEEMEEQESALARERERLEAALAGLRSAETETAEERACLLYTSPATPMSFPSWRCPPSPGRGW